MRQGFPPAAAPESLRERTPFLSGGGAMGALIRSHDWSATPLGPPSRWPAALRTALRILLTTNHPVFLFWGPEHRCFYNDAYSRSLGPEKHPSMLGARGREAWDEIWPIIGPQIEQVMAGSGATWHENHLVPITRHGRLEEVYWTYSYGPIDDADAPHGVGGVLVLCTETTAQVLAERRMRDAEARWRALFDQAPGFMCVLEGPDHRFAYVNRRYLELVGQRDVLGRTVRDALPEVVAQGFVELLDDVYRSGRPYRATAAPILLQGEDGAPPVLRYLDFVYQPIRDADGVITGVLSEGADVTESRLTQERLRDSEARLRQADRRKDEFLATLSHELRNPLAAIRNAARLLSVPEVGREHLAGAGSIIERQVGQLATLLDDLLDVARITQGKLELRRTLAPLESIVDTAIEATRPLFEAKRHELAVSLPERSPMLHADALRMSQVLSNLLANAAKYTDAGGCVALRAWSEGDALLLSVQDSGIGLPADALPGIFEMFAQVQGTRARSDGGLGIGLALVRGLLALHGVTITAHSAGLGLGSEFVVRLPAALLVPAVSGIAAAPARPVGGERGPSGLRVLVADDNVDAADSLAQIIVLAGHHASVANDGLQALALARETRPDVALLDIGMPGLSGYDVAAALRNLPWAADTLLVALTGWGQADDKRRAAAAGFDHHLTKPVDPEDIERLLQVHAVERTERAGSAG